MSGNRRVSLWWTPNIHPLHIDINKCFSSIFILVFIIKNMISRSHWTSTFQWSYKSIQKKQIHQFYLANTSMSLHHKIKCNNIFMYIKLQRIINDLHGFFFYKQFRWLTFCWPTFKITFCHTQFIQTDEINSSLLKADEMTVFLARFDIYIDQNFWQIQNVRRIYLKSIDCLI